MMAMSIPDRDALRAQCDANRARQQCPPATNAFTCGICPVTLVCDVPLKKRAVLFSGESWERGHPGRPKVSL
jgi:hypothetical protein